MIYHTLTKDKIFPRVVFSHLNLLNGINWNLYFKKPRASLFLREIFWISWDQKQAASLIVIAQKDWNLSQDFAYG